jgi:hypothetical protein
MRADAPASTTRDVHLATRLDAPVLLVGHGGHTRREIARLIHARSLRHHGPWVAVDTRESARALEAGFARAAAGTLFLPDVATLNGAQQRQLLRLLARHGPGGTQRAPRIIAGTARDLQDEVRAHRFSRTLFYRLNVIRIDVGGPPPSEFLRGGGVIEVNAGRRLSSGVLRRVCAWCGRTRLGHGTWHDAEGGPGPITHAVCPSCEAEMRLDEKGATPSGGEARRGGSRARS